MDRTSLTGLILEHLALAHDASSGRSAHIVYGGHGRTLRQTRIALTGGSTTMRTRVRQRCRYCTAGFA
ncbi:hypothetical protein [Actinoplanes xinjiangensis]|uniref:Uncharacterized protein n=1 Tax=Actinoplanes xinjiangensis TaxID=512350 RepID=A0A316E9W3_9ACTN|nr:hypothetical protein [Actinoplanes xinjiangensis]PWK26448.1 hypothetical protein BC793_16413 [Actinoplanes xinjiangensis]GIF45245.1 hypothetical protein Axi01nite_95560 [Actinoplanes xinjiangensis]